MQMKALAQKQDEEALQMKAHEQSAPPQTNMPETVQAKMEQAMGADFSNVNIRPGSSKAEGIGALAYTQGNKSRGARHSFCTGTIPT